MKLTLTNLQHTLANSLLSCYALAGEPWTVLQAVTAVRTAAAGQSRRTAIPTQESDWQALESDLATGSLFDSPDCFYEIHILDERLGQAGQKTLMRCLEQVQRPVLVLVASLATASCRHSSWFRHCERHGGALYAWPPRGAAMASWLRQRLKALQLSATPQVIMAMAQRFDGNCMMAEDFLQQSRLLGQRQITAAQLATAPSEHGDVFMLAEAALQGETALTHRLLQGLEQDGTAPQALLGAVLHKIRAALQAGSSALPPQGQIKRRARIHLERVLLEAGHVDAAIRQGQGWPALRLWLLKLATRPRNTMA